MNKCIVKNYINIERNIKHMILFIICVVIDKWGNKADMLETCMEKRRKVWSVIAWKNKARYHAVKWYKT